MTANMMRRTDELVTWLCVAIVHAAYAAPSAKRRQADRQEDAQRAEERHDLAG